MIFTIIPDIGEVGAMGRVKGKFRQQIWLLLAVAILDGALLGAFAGIVDAAGSRTIRTAGEDARAADGGGARAADGGDARAVDGGGARTADREDARAADGGDVRAADGEDARVADGGGVGWERAPEKVVALTFDDGPNEKWTLQLLDGLKERDVQASFFLMGQNIPGNEVLVRRMKEEGHLIGNHSFRHIQLTKAGADVVCQAIEDTENLIEEITGARPAYLRPPYGDWNEELECRMDMTTVLWTLDSLDWKLRNTDAIVRRVEKSVKNGDIILMHDVFPTSVEAALRLVDDLKAGGYHFVTVDELLVD